jgi:hypothetical protein
MVRVHRSWVILAMQACLAGQALMPLAEVRPGMKGSGRSVFFGSKIEEFQVEVLGVLENAGPKQSIILARLSGGPLDRTGVLQGMSGSPVYINGKLVGAVSSSFAFSREPIAGIRPMEELLRAGRQSAARMVRLEPREVTFGDSRLVELATPVSFGGFTQRAVDQFAPQLRGIGLEPRQGVLGGGDAGDRMGDPSQLQPGSMISVQLVSGDLNVGADGTLTHIDGKRVYAFGHRFLAAGATEMPFARAEVLTLLPNLQTSFKISAARELMGAITNDESVGVSGEIGRMARMVPTRIAFGGGATYNLRIVEDRFLTPFLFQMAMFSTIDATERSIGAETLNVTGTIQLAGGQPAVRFQNTYAADMAAALGAAMGATAPLSYLMQSGFRDLRVGSIQVDIAASIEKRQLTIDQVWPSRTVVRPGEDLRIFVQLSGPGGAELLRDAVYRVPVGAPVGALLITAADAATANLGEYSQMLNQPPVSASHVIQFLNGLRPTNAAYVRIGRADPGFQLQGRQLPDPPPSLALLLRRMPATSAMASSLAAEFRLAAGEFAVTGSKTIQVEIKD